MMIRKKLKHIFQKLKHGDPGKRNSGFALVAILLILVLMTALGTGYIMSTSLETQMARTEHDALVAAYVSESGLAYAINRIRRANWLKDIDADHGPGGTYKQALDHVGHYTHEPNHPDFPENSHLPENIMDFGFNDGQCTSEDGCMHELPVNTLFQVWAEPANPGEENFLDAPIKALYSIGFCDMISHTTRVLFRPLPDFLDFAVAADRYISLHADAAVNQTIVGGVWSNGEISQSYGVKIMTDKDGPDDFEGKNPITGVNDDQYVASVGHARLGGFVDGDVYASSADNHQPIFREADPYEENTDRTEIGHVTGWLYLRPSIEPKEGPRYSGYKDNWEDIYEYAEVWGPGFTERTNPICYCASLIDHKRDRSYFEYQDIFTFEDCMDIGRTPTITPSAHTNTHTPTFTPTPMITGTPPPTRTFTNTPTSTPTFICNNPAWLDDGHWSRYCGRAEEDCNVAAAFCPGYFIQHPYKTWPNPLLCNFDEGIDNTHYDIQPADGEYLENPPEGNCLTKKHIVGYFNFDYYKQLAGTYVDTGYPDGMVFNDWGEFNDYIESAVNGSPQYARIVKYHGWEWRLILGNELQEVYPVFYIDDPSVPDSDEPYGWMNLKPINDQLDGEIERVYIHGTIVTTGSLDIRDIDNRWRRPGARYRTVRADVRDPTDVSVWDGCKRLIIDCQNYERPALAAKGDIWITRRNYFTDIFGLVYAEGKIKISNDNVAGRVWVGNPNDMVISGGAVVGRELEFNGFYYIEYDPEVKNLLGCIDLDPRQIEIVSIEKSFYYNF